MYKRIKLIKYKNLRYENTFLNHNIKGHGTYIRCFNFARHLKKFGHTVNILTAAPRHKLLILREIIDGVVVITMPEIFGRRLRNGGLGIIDTILRCHYCLRNDFDIVENYDHRPSVLYPALISKYICNTKLVSEWTDLHGTGGSLNNRPKALQAFIRPYEDFTELRSKRIPDKLVVISQGLKQRALNLNVPEDLIEYIPGGSDIKNILPKSKFETRKKFGLPVNKKIIVYAAGTHYDIELFIMTICRIQKELDDVVFVTTGAVIDAKNKKKMYDPNRIIELGFLSYIKYSEVLSAADIFLFPYANTSLNQGRWPNKVGDYMAAGRPTVTNPTGDMIELFNRHHIGLLAEDKPDDMANKTIDLIKNKNKMCELGKNARLTAEKFYDWEILSRKLEKCFFDVLKFY